MLKKIKSINYNEATEDIDIVLSFKLEVQRSCGKSFVGYYGSQPCYEEDYYETEENYDYEVEFWVLYEYVFADIMPEEDYDDIVENKNFDLLEKYIMNNIFAIEELATEDYYEKMTGEPDYYD